MPSTSSTKCKPNYGGQSGDDILDSGCEDNDIPVYDAPAPLTWYPTPDTVAESDNKQTKQFLKKRILEELQASLKASLKKELLEELQDIQALKNQTDLKVSLKKEILEELQDMQAIKKTVEEQLINNLPELAQKLLLENESSGELRKIATADKVPTLGKNGSSYELRKNPTVDKLPSHRMLSADRLPSADDMSRVDIARSKSKTLVSEVEEDQKNLYKLRQSVGAMCKAHHEDGLPILDARANALGAQDWVYNWAETMWDAMPFIGLNVMSVSDSMLVILVAILNLAIQAAFIGLVGTNMVQSLFDDDEIVETLTDWRVSYAHNPDFADKFTSTPLGSDICAQSAFLMQGSQQAGLYVEVFEYIQKFLGMPAGGCLSLLSIFLWILTCGKEMKRTCLFVVGLWTPNADGVSICNTDVKSSYVVIQERTVLWVYGEATQKNYQVFLTRCHVLMLSFLVVLPRIVILVSLGIVGTQFLVATTELDELILNAVALEVILNVDELLFAIFAPDSALRVVRKTKPLRVPKLRGAAAQIAPWIRLAIVTGLMFYITFVFLSPLIQTMTDAEQVMCGGEVDFLAVELVFGSVVSGVPEVSGIDRTSYRYQSIYRRTGLGDTSDKPALVLEGEPFGFTRVQTLDKWRDRSITDWASQDYSDKTFIACVDLTWVNYMNPKLETGMWAGVSAKLGFEATNCEQVKAFCFEGYSDEGKAVRLLCPATCGGADPLSGLFTDTPVDGVTDECKSTYANVLATIPCKDPPLSVLNNKSHPIGRGWSNYLASLNSLMAPSFMVMSVGNMTKYQEYMNHLGTQMSTYGCSFFRRDSPLKGRIRYKIYNGDNYDMDICDVDSHVLLGRRTVRIFCPEACGCSTIVKKRYETLGETTWNERIGLESECPGTCWDSVDSR